MELLHHYIISYRTKEMSAEELKRKKELLVRDLVNHWDNRKMFDRACEIRNRQSEWFIKAEKDGCPICRKLVRIFDGRDLE